MPPFIVPWSCPAVTSRRCPHYSRAADIFEGGAHVQLSTAELAEVRASWFTAEVERATAYYAVATERLTARLPPLQWCTVAFDAKRCVLTLRFELLLSHLDARAA